MLECSGPVGLTTEHLKAFCKATGAPSVTPTAGETPNVTLLRRLRTYLSPE